MKISVRNLEPTKVKLTITVDPEEFNPYLDAARKEIAKQVTVPGFRKGHVPGKIIDQRIGFAAVAGEAVNNGVPELYSKALEEKKIRPMSQPEIDVQEVPTSAKDETKLKFVATVERRPDIELPELDGMEIEVPKAEITDEDVNRRLENLRQRFGTLVGVDRPAAKGDYANIDLVAEIDGETVDSQEGVSYELGSNTMLDGLDEALDGLSAGEETTFEGTLEAGEHEGEKAQIKVKVNSVKAEELPELDDDFAQEASEFDTLDELKADIRKACERDAEGRQATEARDAFIAKLKEGLEIPVPKGVKAEAAEQHLKGMTPDSGAGHQGAEGRGRGSRRERAARPDGARRPGREDGRQGLPDGCDQLPGLHRPAVRHGSVGVHQRDHPQRPVGLRRGGGRPFEGPAGRYACRDLQVRGRGARSELLPR